MPSLFPPGANGMMILTGRCGHPSARAGSVRPALARAAKLAKKSLRVAILLQACLRAAAPDWRGLLDTHFMPSIANNCRSVSHKIQRLVVAQCRAMPSCLV
jgi:hypothetical protein